MAMSTCPVRGSFCRCVVGAHCRTEYDGIELKVRGDGRSYVFNMQTTSMQPEDLYQAFVYTRGGPDLQTVQVTASVDTALMITRIFADSLL